MPKSARIVHVLTVAPQMFTTGMASTWRSDMKVVLNVALAELYAPSKILTGTILMVITAFSINLGEVIFVIKLDRKKMPYVNTEGTVLCSSCRESYEITQRQKLHSIIVTECPHCGHQNINVFTNSIKFVDEVLEKIEVLKKELLELRQSLEIEFSEGAFLDNYPEAFQREREEIQNPKPKLL